MLEIATTKLSSKGQVVIPENIRKELNLETGARFVVIGEKDAVILKRIAPSSTKKFDALLKKDHKTAKEIGLMPSDVDALIKEVRSEK